MKQIKIAYKLTDRTNETFKQYLKEVADIPIFTPEEELICAKKAFAGDKKAIDELTRRNLRFVISVAKQYVTDNIPLLDLINEGNIGLYLAAEKFDPSLGHKFISFAVWWVRKVILAHISRDGKAIRLPSNKINSLAKFDKITASLEQKYERKVDVADVIASSNEFTSKEFMFIDTLSSYNMDSLDREIDETGSVLSELFEDDTFKPTDHLVAETDVSYQLNKALMTLKPRNKMVIEALFGLNGQEPKSLEQVGDEIGLTREMIRQIKVKSLIKLKTIVKQLEIN